MSDNVWEEWLRKVENVGFCMRYEAALRKQPHSVEQLFKELGTVPEAHRKILTKLYANGAARANNAVAAKGNSAPSNASQARNAARGTPVTKASAAACTAPATAPKASAVACMSPAASRVSAVPAASSASACASAVPADPVSAPSIEKRIDPDDGVAYTFTELEAKYAEDPFTKEEVLDYWEHDCEKIALGHHGESLPASPAPLFSTPHESSAGFAAWLLKVDPSGACSKSYLQTMEENYDSVDQIKEVYVTEKEKQKHLDLQFFDDVGIEDEGHRRLFSTFFEAEYNSGPSLQCKNMPVQDSEPVDEGLTLAAWLQAVDPSGGCSQSLLKDIEENFDSPDQIEALYVLKTGASQRLDPEFFADLGIEDAEQRRLFTDYFESGAVADAASSSAALSTAEGSVSALGHGSPGNLTFSQWVQCIDPSGSCQRYVATMYENYDDVDQILDLYLEDSPAGDGKVFDTRFFEDIGLSEAGHRELFEIWVHKKYVSAEEA